MALLRSAFLPPSLVSPLRICALLSPITPSYSRLHIPRNPRPRLPNAHRANHAPPSSKSNNPPNSPQDADPFQFDGELFASSPELEQLATRSSDAPILCRIVSYNILSSSLADPSHFPDCDSSNLSASIRLQRILTKLEGPVASRSIICLQEVSLSWSGPLHQFFAQRGFHLLIASHGSYFNGYMGEALAFPLDLYEPLDLSVERLTDAMSWPGSPKQSPLSALIKRFCDASAALFGPPRSSRRRNKNRNREPWQHARARHNRFIFARLRSRTNGATICVATYHMPCVYWSPPVMLIHSALAVATFQRLCGSDAGVLAGDFNVKPGDSSYEMILAGQIDPSHEHYPSVTPDGTPATKWFPTLSAPMKSAYREVLGAEPDFTNYAKVEGQPTFIETLDYIFCTSSIDVVDVIRLPNRDAVQGPFPDASEPSDHVMIGATLRLPAPVRTSRAPLSRFRN